MKFLMFKLLRFTFQSLVWICFLFFIPVSRAEALSHERNDDGDDKSLTCSCWGPNRAKAYVTANGSLLFGGVSAGLGVYIPRSPYHEWGLVYRYEAPATLSGLSSSSSSNGSNTDTTGTETVSTNPTVQARYNRWGFLARHFVWGGSFFVEEAVGLVQHFYQNGTTPSPSVSGGWTDPYWGFFLSIGLGNRWVLWEKGPVLGLSYLTLPLDFQSGSQNYAEIGVQQLVGVDVGWAF